MNKAIISGATGMVGRAVTKFLVKNGVEVLCLGRKHLTATDLYNIFGVNLSYVSLDMKNIEKLPEIIDKLNWRVGNNCNFFNFAWSGSLRLTDGSFEEQLNNVTFAANAVKVSKKIGCVKFINSGTLEETYIEQSLKNKSILYASGQENYALAKLAARDMCNIVAYLEKIDYVHTRLSAPLNPDLSTGTYIAKTLNDISKGRPYEQPKNNQLFDIIFLDDVAEAYFLIGQHGKNKANYFIGTSKPTNLKDYFSEFDRVVRGSKVVHKQQAENLYQLFDNQELCKDTGFIPSTNRYNLLAVSKYK